MKTKAMIFVSGAILLLCVALLTAFLMQFSGLHDTDKALANLTPWQRVGGCGAGGSGGSAADVKWIGQGQTGGLIDAEVMGSVTLGQNFEYQQVKTRLSMKPTWTTNLGLTIPIVSKTGELQPQTNYDDKTETSGGLADIMVDVSKNIGMEGEYALSLNVTLPTGQYDIKRGKENEMLYLPTTLQCGSGVFNASLGISRSIDVEKGLWIVEAYYNQPFAVNFKGKNQFVNNGSDQYNAINSVWDDLTDDQKNRFQYYFKPYGENDLGGYTPPSVTAAVYYGNRRQEHYVHSFGAKAFIPLGVAWIPDYSASSYNPVPDPNFKAWSVTLHYGLEFSRPEYPIYLAVNKVICSRSSPNPNDPYDEKSLARWHAPDVKELLNDNWIFAVGIKTTMF